MGAPAASRPSMPSRCASASVPKPLPVDDSRRRREIREVSFIISSAHVQKLVGIEQGVAEAGQRLLLAILCLVLPPGVGEPGQTLPRPIALGRIRMPSEYYVEGQIHLFLGGGAGRFCHSLGDE